MVEIEDRALCEKTIKPQADFMPPLSYLKQYASEKALIAGIAEGENAYNNRSLEVCMAGQENSFMYDETIDIPNRLFETQGGGKGRWKVYRKDAMLDRTQFMAQAMQAHMRGDNILTVIGAEHLYGGSGLLAQLVQSGYPVVKLVEQIRSKAGS